MKENETGRSSLVKFLINFGIVIAAIVVLSLVGLGGWRILWVTKVDNYEMAFNYNWWTGKVESIDRTGWIIRAPIVNSVHTIDLRPYQISIVANIQQNAAGQGSSAIGSRILNAKLVRFNPQGLSTFIAWHGRKAGNDLSEMLEILKAYAYDQTGGKDCPFLIVLGEVAPNQAGQAVPAEKGAK